MSSGRPSVEHLPRGIRVRVSLLLFLPDDILFGSVYYIVSSGVFPMANAIITGIVSGVITSLILALLFAAWRLWIRWLTSEEYTIELNKLPPKMSTPKLKFGVLYIQDEDGTVKNTTHWFKKNRTDKLSVGIRHPRSLGFQYKCFVDNHSNHTFSEISKCLIGLNYIHVSIGGGKPDRIWFILPDKPNTKDARKNLNNYYYPE
jgi:hypothetical protein